MKITGLEIGEYRQFKNIKFDFTYPKGHPKEGQPLDKVCFIGQSGTGKSTLLNIFWEYFRLTDDAYQVFKNRSVIHNNNDSYDAFYHSILISVKEGDKNASYKSNVSEDTENHESIRVGDAIEFLDKTELWKQYDVLEKVCLYIEDGVVNESSRFLNPKNYIGETPISGHLLTQILTDEELGQISRRQEEERRTIVRSKAVGVSYHLANIFWQYILSDIGVYNTKFRKFTTNLIQESGNISPNSFYEKFTTWSSENPNPLLDLAQNCLNPILNKLYLGVDVEASGEFIVLKTISGKQINNKYLSTGAKQLIATSLAIYKSVIKHGVILFDEPERSLFPDIQRILVDYYISLAPTAQFFFATHSPIIASAFEPCERFILYFDENGEVKFRNGVAPEGDDPNDILSQDFGMEYLMLQKGLEEYDRYRQLGAQIRNEKDESRKNDLIAERLELGNRYNF